MRSTTPRILAWLVAALLVLTPMSTGCGGDEPDPSAGPSPEVPVEGQDTGQADVHGGEDPTDAGLGDAGLPDAGLPDADLQDTSGSEDVRVEDVQQPSADVVFAEDVDATSEPDGDGMEDVMHLDTAPDDVGFPSPVYEAGGRAFGSTQVVPGTGRREFEPLVQGQVIRWEAGVQGGHHIWVAVTLDDALVTAFTEEERRQIVHRYRIWHEDGELLAETRRQGGIRWVEDAWVGVGQYAVLEAPRRPSRLDGDHLLMRVDVSLPDLQTFFSEIWLISECCD